MGTLLGGALKTAAVGAGAAVGTVLGTAITKGFQRLSAIEEAEAKLRGLGNSAKTVTQIMDDALASVKGTAFGLGDAAGIAASAVAAGVKPGKELERTLRLVGDAATIGGTSLSEMGAIFNKVAATGKAQGEVIQQLGERGIPILQLLSKSLGVTTEEVLELSKEGKISFADFQKAIEEGMGGAALKSGETFKGALANAGAALGRFGAALLGPTFKDGPGVFSRITEKVDELTPAAAKVGTQIQRMKDKIEELSKSKDWKRLVGDMKEFGRNLLTVSSALVSIVSSMNKLSKESTGSGLLHWLLKLEDFIGPLSTITKLLDAAVEAWKYLKGNPLPGDSGSIIDDGGAGSDFGDGGDFIGGITSAGGGSVASVSTAVAASSVTHYNFYGPESLSQARRDEDWSRTYGTRFGSAASAAAR